MTGSDRGPWRSRIATITGELGLHARPAARFVKLAGTFDAEITVANKSGKVSGNSIMGLMMLAAASGTELEISAQGPDAAEALDGDGIEVGADRLFRFFGFRRGLGRGFASEAFLDLAEEDFDRVLRVNLKGAFLCAQAAALRMVAQAPRGSGDSP